MKNQIIFFHLSGDATSLNYRDLEGHSDTLVYTSSAV